MIEKPTKYELSAEDIRAIERGLRESGTVEVKWVGGRVVIIKIRRQKMTFEDNTKHPEQKKFDEFRRK